MRPEFFPSNISALLKRKKELNAFKKRNVIEISNEMLSLIKSSNYIPKNGRGKALGMLNIGSKKRKRSAKRESQMAESPAQREGPKTAFSKTGIF